jgi:hypothetical protein
MVDRVKRRGRAPLTLTRLGWFYHHDGMYAKKWPLSLCVYTLWAKHCWHRLSIVYAQSSAKHAALPFPLFCSNTTGKKDQNPSPRNPNMLGKFCLPYTACKPHRMRVFAAQSFFKKLSKVCWHCAAMGSPSSVARGELLSWNNSKYRRQLLFCCRCNWLHPHPPLAN